MAQDLRLSEGTKRKDTKKVDWTARLKNKQKRNEAGEGREEGKRTLGVKNRKENSIRKLAEGRQEKHE